MAYYFVVVENRPKNGDESDIGNSIIKDVHPVIWASNTSENYRKYYTTYLRFWQEIPYEVAMEAKRLNYIECDF